MYVFNYNIIDRVTKENKRIHSKRKVLKQRMLMWVELRVSSWLRWEARLLSISKDKINSMLTNTKLDV